MAKGKLLPIELNVEHILLRHERYSGLVWLDQIRGFLYENSTGKPRCVSDAWLVGELTWMQEHISFYGISRSKVFETLLGKIPEHFSRNPLLEEIEATEWDGTARLESMFVRAFGASDDVYTRAVGRNWLVGAVARLADPGCQFDNMLILEGDQGIRKSTALSVLSSGYYVELKGDITSKDFALNAHTGWIADVIELGALRRADVDHMKGEITTREDTIRAPYERTAKIRPRRFVLAGTSNTNDYLRDSTGNRRFWPIKCNPVVKEAGTGVNIVDIPWLEANRGQLLSEALVKYRSGHLYWDMPPDETANVQSARMAHDPMVDMLTSILGDPTKWRVVIIRGAPYHFIGTSEILHAMKTEPMHFDAMTAKVARAMRLMPGWVRSAYMNSSKPIALTTGAVSTQVRGYMHPLVQPVSSGKVTTLPTSKKSKFAPTP
jgi:hypothetical protein